MKIEVKKLIGWGEVLDAARFTVRKQPLDKADEEVSLKFKKRMMISEHSPVRLLTFRIRVYDVPKFVIMHLVRHHEGIEKFVCTNRPDRNGNKTTRHEQHDDDLVNCQFVCNAQALINISKVRLCFKAEKETRELWQEIQKAIKPVDSVMWEAMVPSCCYRGYCPEDNSCMFHKTKYAKVMRAVAYGDDKC